MAKHYVLFEAGPMLDSKKSGVGYYVQHLISSLYASHSVELQLTGYYFNFLSRNSKNMPQGDNWRFNKIWLIPGKLLAICRRLSFQLPLEIFMRIPKETDTVLFTNYVALPLIKKRKVILVVYDLGFLDVPQFTQTINLRYLTRFCPPSIRQADTIITISEFTKQRLEYHFPNLRANVVVTPVPPMETVVSKVSLDSRLVNMGIRAESYILYVGTVEPRKNLEMLIDAYSLLDHDLRSSYSLVIAGGKGWKDESILDVIAEQKTKGLDIVMTGYVSEPERAALYSNAACFILPSHYEGFGMPVLEAMQYGLPVLVSDIPVFHEVAGDAALYFDKESSVDIAAKLTTGLTDKKVIEQLVQRSNDRLQTFSWSDNADKVYKALELV